jgi:hypothetical protein
MANPTDTIPPSLMRPERKPDVITYIKGTSLPARFRRKMLQDWAAAVRVDLTGADYEAVTEN